MIPHWCWYWHIYSIMLATLVIPLTCGLMRLMIPKTQGWAIVGPAMKVLSPGFVYHNSVLTNTGLESSLTVLILCVTVCCILRCQPTYKQAMSLVALLGFAALAKVTAMLLMSTIAAAALMYRPNSWTWGIAYARWPQDVLWALP